MEEYLLKRGNESSKRTSLKEVKIASVSMFDLYLIFLRREKINVTDPRDFHLMIICPFITFSCLFSRTHFSFYNFPIRFLALSLSHSIFPSLSDQLKNNFGRGREKSSFGKRTEKRRRKGKGQET